MLCYESVYDWGEILGANATHCSLFAPKITAQSDAFLKYSISGSVNSGNCRQCATVLKLQAFLGLSEDHSRKKHECFDQLPATFLTWRKFWNTLIYMFGYNVKHNTVFLFDRQEDKF